MQKFAVLAVAGLLFNGCANQPKTTRPDDQVVVQTIVSVVSGLESVINNFSGTPESDAPGATERAKYKFITLVFTDKNSLTAIATQSQPRISPDMVGRYHVIMTGNSPALIATIQAGPTETGLSITFSPYRKEFISPEGDTVRFTGTWTDDEFEKLIEAASTSRLRNR